MPRDNGTGQTGLRAIGVSAGYGTGRRPAPVLHGIDLAVAAGQAVGVVGESGSGKSTLARVLAGQLRPVAGQVLLGGTDLAELHGGALRAARRRIQLIPQDPYASLDPRMTIRRALAEAIDPIGRRPHRRDQAIAGLLRSVGLDADAAGRYPHEFSGGQRQRIAIARALAVQPEVIIADEITSALDTSVQADILNLLRGIRDQAGVALVFITHDLSVASYLCQDICVLYLGRIVEHGPRQLLFAPRHHYTRLLVDSVPRPGTADEQSAAVLAVAAAHDTPDPTRPPPGCPFHPCCPAGPAGADGAADRAVCACELPVLSRRGPDAQAHLTACHFPLVLSDPATQRSGGYR